MMPPREPIASPRRRAVRLSHTLIEVDHDHDGDDERGAGLVEGCMPIWRDRGLARLRAEHELGSMNAHIQKGY